MASLDWEHSRRDGVTLVELVVTAETEEWIRIESRLQPVWPPRRQGVPVAGWDEDGFEGRVGPNDRLVLGYASPAAPVDPPARLRTVEETRHDAAEVTARELVRTLGESAPPREAVPTPDCAASTGGPASGGDGGSQSRDSGGGPVTNGESTDGHSPDGREAAIEREHAEQPDGVDRPGERSETVDRSQSVAGGALEAVEPWFEGVEHRLARAERLAGVAGADEARAAIDDAGGIEAVRQLQGRIERDRRQLRELGRRHGRIADRLDTVEIPLSTLERVT